MGSITESVEEGYYIFVQVVFNWNNIGCRNAEIFSESTVAVYTNTTGTFAPVAVAGTAVVALTANQMAFTGNALTNSQAFNAFTQFSDFADVFVTDYYWWFDVSFSPAVPVIDMYVGTADSGFTNFDQNFACTWSWNRNLSQNETSAFLWFNQSIHHFCHGKCISFIIK